MRKILSAARHLLGLINDVLDLSKIEAGKMQLYLETFDLQTLVHEVGSTIAPLVEKRNEPLIVNCSPPAIGSMYGDATKIRQTLLNLLSNASKFTENGRIELKIDREITRQPGLGRHARHGYGHRHDRGADGPAVHGLHPGRRLHLQQVRRHRARASRSPSSSPR